MIVAIIAVMIWMDVRLTLVTLLTVPCCSRDHLVSQEARQGYDLLVRTRIGPDLRVSAGTLFRGATVQIFNAKRNRCDVSRN